MKYETISNDFLVLGIISNICAMQIIDINSENDHNSHPPTILRKEKIYKYLIELGISQEYLDGIDSDIEKLIEDYQNFIRLIEDRNIPLIFSSIEIIFQIVNSEYKI